MKLRGLAHTDVGQERGHNEDFHIVREDLGLYLVADGMGGHAAGEVASRVAAEAVVSFLERHTEDLRDFKDTTQDRDLIAAIVRRSIEAATAEVYELAVSSEGKAGMGTTLTMVLLLGNKGFMGHVGDSRLYLSRRNELHQLSDDHTYVAELVRRGTLTREQAENSPYSNAITRAVGIQDTVQVDTLVFDVLAGDTLLLCSDGLSGYLNDNDELGELMNHDGLNELPSKLVEIANERGGKDNITAICIRAEGESEEELDELRSTEVNLRIDTLKFIPLFKHLTMKELMEVMEHLECENHQGGETIIKEGDRSDALYVVLSGQLEVMRAGKRIALLDAGTHFGEMALLNQRPRSATIRSLEKSRVLAMKRDAFNTLLRKNNTLGLKFLWTFAQVLSLRLDEALADEKVEAETKETLVDRAFRPSLPDSEEKLDLDTQPLRKHEG